ncbi:hypothetical protein [uncultured Endozoicomonas sp.]|uniref:hypothetical protein n=1 Tax=uncultured Endozoicomonas sp. TaxID=432652 RepID=UPI00261A9DB3|nr:hypothetical protein [uncultured Endozoicomonas sp.]
MQKSSDQQHPGLQNLSHGNLAMAFFKTAYFRADTRLYHGSRYLGGLAEALLPTSKAKRKLWLEDRLHYLKHKSGVAKKIPH